VIKNSYTSLFSAFVVRQCNSQLSPTLIAYDDDIGRDPFRESLLLGVGFGMRTIQTP